MASDVLRPSPPPTKILVAVGPDGRERIERVLTGHLLTYASSVADAERALTGGRFELIVLDVSFDESRMFELLAHLRSLEAYKAVPVICVLAVQTRMSAISVEAVDRATKALMANAFLWLEKFPDDEGGNARIRRIADYLILIDGDMHQGVKEA